MGEDVLVMLSIFGLFSIHFQKNEATLSALFDLGISVFRRLANFYTFLVILIEN